MCDQQKPAAYLRVGQIARAHGVHGEVKVLPLTADADRFYQLKQAYIERNGGYTPVEVGDARVQPEAVYLRLSCAQTREEADALKSLYLCVDRAHALKLPPGQYFVADMLGCRVEDTAGAHYGVLTDVLETGANDVYVIQGKQTLLVPAIKKLLYQVDIDGKRIVLEAGVLKEVGLFED
ncbi:MAG: ribosome maturation factor RimM [Christensenellaceae bacterium]|jgi:16S rRNA processing protein RimM|nr:ribosome maturation factor RimM [Christensenellaceae bacterium]